MPASFIIFPRYPFPFRALVPCSHLLTAVASFPFCPMTISRRVHCDRSPTGKTAELESSE